MLRCYHSAYTPAFAVLSRTIHLPAFLWVGRQDLVRTQGKGGVKVRARCKRYEGVEARDPSRKGQFEEWQTKESHRKQKIKKHMGKGKLLGGRGEERVPSNKSICRLFLQQTCKVGRYHPAAGRQAGGEPEK